MERKKLLHMNLNSIEKVEDPTILAATFVLFDFDKSHNNAVIEKEVGLSAASTVKNKPIVAKYYKTSDDEDQNDALGSHEVQVSENRDGELHVEYDTIAIGSFTSEGYVGTIDTPDGEKEVMMADAILWYSRYPDPINLLLEWNERGIKVNTSVELLYSNYNFVDGVEYLQAPIYIDGHALLNSEKRGDHEIVLPAYDSSELLTIEQNQQFSKLIAQAASKEIKETVKEGGKEMTFKKVFELSHEDVRSKIYQEFDPTLSEDQYSWISEVYDDSFIVNIEDYKEGEYDYKTFKINYTKDDTGVTIDAESKTEVVLEKKWVELEEVQTLQAEKEALLNSKNEVEAQKTDVETKLNSATDKITDLSEQISQLNEYKEKFETAEFEKSLETQKEYFSKKFKALNEAEKFDSEEVQELVEKVAKGDNDAKLSLNSMLVDLVVFNDQEDNKEKDSELKGREFAKERKDLLPKDNSFEARYLDK